MYGGGIYCRTGRCGGLYGGEKKGYGQAIADYTQMIGIVPDSFAYSSRGYYYEKKGDYDRAIAGL
jgi:tetratricopeptide (TPR) repeat protein